MLRKETWRIPAEDSRDGERRERGMRSLTTPREGEKLSYLPPGRREEMKGEESYSRREVSHLTMTRRW
jgi:hypothetical protein